MRRIATPLAAAALTGALVAAPTPAVAAESPLPHQLTQQLTQTICQAQDVDMPAKASVLVGPFLPKAPAVPHAARAPESPQIC